MLPVADRNLGSSVRAIESVAYSLAPTFVFAADMFFFVLPGTWTA